MEPLPPQNVRITGGFWGRWLEMNRRRAIFHQWEQLEDSGCIDNFRIAAGEKERFRQGWFFADSDAYKWLDAASRILLHDPDPALAWRVDSFLALLQRARMPDGYLYTYNQIHFPGTRWVNLQIEHELYCHGHMIEAGVSHYQATGRTDGLELARRAADLLVRDFLGARPEGTDGHEEVEIALLRLYEVTGHRPYLDMARQFVENRGRIPHFWLSVLRQNASMQARRRAVERQRAAYQAAHPEYTPPPLPPENFAPRPPFSRLRWYLGALTGKYFQQHAPIRQQRVPVGHAVRFGYLMTAAAMLCRLGADGGLLTAMEAAWEHMVTRRMYVTGGLGALPDLEGFGRDYELHPEYAYAETCAALASLFWNWQMTLLTGEARYADLLEWQLYNAALVGMGLNGDAYLYNNPLLCRGGVERRAWYAVPCCPSNLSRTLAWLGQYICSRDADTVWVHQYISGRVDLGDGWVLDVESGLPWQGQVRIRLEGKGPDRMALCLRVPSWVGATALRVNGAEVPADALPPATSAPPTACGYDPRRARSVRIDRRWAPGDELMVEFAMPIRLLRQDRRLPGCGGRVAVARGPLVYCLESVDNPGVDLFHVEVVPESLETVHDAEELGGMVMLRGMSVRGERLTFIPYMLWANRGPSQMTVFVGG
jgi:DUF1680 family protein